MAREFSRKFYNSKEWIQCRKGYKQSVYGLCERCEQPGYEVHHKIYLTPNNINDPNITLNWNNLELLCESCHSKQHMSNDNIIVREGFKFNDKGEMVHAPAPHK